MIKKYKINENECGYLIRRGRFEKLLTVGTYYFLSLSGCEVKIVPMTGAVNTYGIPEEILMKNPEFASRVVKNVLPDTSIAIRFVNGAFREVVCKPETLFWNVFEKNEFQVIDITKPWMEETLPRMYMELMPAKYYKKIVIKDGETGLLYFDNQFERQLEISGQEILTADKVGGAAECDLHLQDHRSPEAGNADGKCGNTALYPCAADPQGICRTVPSG